MSVIEQSNNIIPQLLLVVAFVPETVATACAGPGWITLHCIEYAGKCLLVSAERSTETGAGYLLTDVQRGTETVHV